MAIKMFFLLALFGLASSSLPYERRCDPEQQKDTPTKCSNYKNIEHLDEMLTKLEQRIAAVEVPRIAFSTSLANSGRVCRGPSSGKNKILVFKRVFSNTGNAYNQDTGIFTAPVNGVYYFSFSTFGYNTHVMGAILMKNKVHQVSTYEHISGDGSDSSSNSVVLQLVAKDEVHMQLWDNGRVSDNLNGHTTFSGYLLFTV
ncbi:hypothetical protein PAMP_015879 [Pampus punctatissimus]